MPSKIRERTKAGLPEGHIPSHFEGWHRDLSVRLPERCLHALSEYGLRLLGFELEGNVTVVLSRRMLIAVNS